MLGSIENGEQALGVYLKTAFLHDLFFYGLRWGIVYIRPSSRQCPEAV